MPVRGIIFDLGDVLFTWSPNTETTISAGTLRKILSSSTWLEYECGHLEQYESLQPDDMVVAFLRHLRKSALVSVYAMSNVAKEDFAALSSKMDWSLFDQVFTSGEVGMRKPDHGFFCHVLDQIKFAPAQVVFVDDKQENVLAADQMGIKGIIFDESTIHTLQNLLGDPIARGYEYLYRNAKQFDSITDGGIVVKDNFAELLILEATQDKSLVNVRSYFQRTWNFFAGKVTLVPGGYFPDDLDTTSLALTALRPESPNIVTSILNEMCEYLNDDGTFLTYFDREKPRTDTVVTANVLACFYHFGRGDRFTHTLQHIHDVLLHRAYMHGPLLKSELQERVGESGSATDLAMRVIACDSLGIECSVDRHTLLCLQCQDGGWESGWMYRYGSTGVRIGNRGVTTALALKAIASPSVVNEAVASAENVRA